MSNRNTNKILINKFEELNKLSDKSTIKSHDFYMNKIFAFDMKGHFFFYKSLQIKYIPDAVSAKIKLSLIMIIDNYFQFLVFEQRITSNIIMIA